LEFFSSLIFPKQQLVNYFPNNNKHPDDDHNKQPYRISMYGCGPDAFPGYPFDEQDPLTKSTKLEKSLECDPTLEGMGWVAALYFIFIVIFGALILPTMLIGIVAISFEDSFRRSEDELTNARETKKLIARVQTDMPKFFSDNRLEHLRKVFRTIDIDGGGTLDLHEASPLVKYIATKHLHVTLSSSEVSDFINFCDKDASGDISFGELLMIIRYIIKARTSGRLKAMKSHRELGAQMKALKMERRRSSAAAAASSSSSPTSVGGRAGGGMADIVAAAVKALDDTSFDTSMASEDGHNSPSRSFRAVRNSLHSASSPHMLLSLNRSASIVAAEAPQDQQVPIVVAPPRHQLDLQVTTLASLERHQSYRTSEGNPSEFGYVKGGADDSPEALAAMNGRRRTYSDPTQKLLIPEPMIETLAGRRLRKLSVPEQKSWKEGDQEDEEEKIDLPMAAVPNFTVSPTAAVAEEVPLPPISPKTAAPAAEAAVVRRPRRFSLAALPSPSRFRSDPSKSMDCSQHSSSEELKQPSDSSSSSSSTMQRQDSFESMVSELKAEHFSQSANRKAKLMNIALAKAREEDGLGDLIVKGHGGDDDDDDDDDDSSSSSSSESSKSSSGGSMDGGGDADTGGGGAPQPISLALQKFQRAVRAIIAVVRFNELLTHPMTSPRSIPPSLSASATTSGGDGPGGRPMNASRKVQPAPFMSPSNRRSITSTSNRRSSTTSSMGGSMDGSDFDDDWIAEDLNVDAFDVDGVGSGHHNYGERETGPWVEGAGAGAGAGRRGSMDEVGAYVPEKEAILRRTVDAQRVKLAKQDVELKLLREEVRELRARCDGTTTVTAGPSAGGSTLSGSTGAVPVNSRVPAAATKGAAGDHPSSSSSLASSNGERSTTASGNIAAAASAAVDVGFVEEARELPSAIQKRAAGRQSAQELSIPVEEDFYSLSGPSSRSFDTLPSFQRKGVNGGGGGGGGGRRLSSPTLVPFPSLQSSSQGSTNALEGNLDQPGLSGDNDAGGGSGRRGVSNEEDADGCTVLVEDLIV
jgi:hypothetical protein